MRDRKSAAVQRAWSEYPRSIGQTGPTSPATLFIEDAIGNLGIGRDEEEEGGRDVLDLGRLKQSSLPSSPPLRHRRDSGGHPLTSGPSMIYPPDNVRAAVDLLFLEGSSDLILAKKAIVSF